MRRALLLARPLLCMFRLLILSVLSVWLVRNVVASLAGGPFVDDLLDAGVQEFLTKTYVHAFVSASAEHQQQGARSSLYCSFESTVYTTTRGVRLCVVGWARTEELFLLLALLCGVTCLCFFLDRYCHILSQKFLSSALFFLKSGPEKLSSVTRGYVVPRACSSGDFALWRGFEDD